MRLLLALLLAVLLGACSPDAPPELLRLSGETMGTTWSVALRLAPGSPDPNNLERLLQQRLDRINRQMSTYDPASEVSRFNTYSGTEWFAVSNETARVVALSLDVSRQTGGAFDITVGPLVDLWGFGSTPQTGLPSAARVDSARARIGYTKLELRMEPAAIRKRQPDLQIDLSAVAKGYAVDELAEFLKSQGIWNFLVEVGGELQVAGERAAGQPWRVAIEKPLKAAREVAAIVPLSGVGLATSGNYRNFYEVNGQTYSHTIDPVSGAPVRHKLASVTVLDQSCALADALATALMVLGEERARTFADANRLAAYLQVFSDDGFVVIVTPEFKRLAGGAAL